MLIRPRAQFRDLSSSGLSDSVTVENLAALKALTSRPESVVVKTGQAAGVWQWVLGSSSTANDALVINPTNGTAGRYKRIYSGALNPVWFGAVGDGVTPDTAAFAAAALVGGEIVFPPGDYLTGPVVFSVEGTRLRGVGRARFLDVASSTGNLISLNADYCSMVGIEVVVSQSPSLNTAVLCAEDYYYVEDVVVTGPRQNPLLPNAAIYPNYAIRCQKSDGSRHIGGRLIRTSVVGTSTGYYCFNQDSFEYENPEASYCGAQGMNIGSGASSRRGRISRPRFTGCGQYGFTFAAQTAPYWTGTSPFPYEDIDVTDAYAENCGWDTYYTGANASDVGNSKLGFDLTDGGNYRLKFDGTAINCSGGGGEFKGGTLSFGSLTPPGRKNPRIHLDYYTNVDRGVAFYALMEDATAGPTLMSEVKISGSSTYNVAPDFLTGMPYRPFDWVASNGYIWQCFGDASGLAGVAGATAPTGGTASVILTTNGATAAGSAVLNFADASTVIDGTVVFAGPNVPDGTTVVSHTGTTVVISAAATGSGVGSGDAIMFMKKVSDGTLSWMCYAATPARSISVIGVEVRGGTNIDVDWRAMNCAFGAYARCTDGTDNNIASLSLKLHGRGLLYGIVVAGTGGVTSTNFHGCDIEALNPLIIGPSGSTDITVSGGRYKISSGGGQTLRIDAGTNTLRLEGGVYFTGITYCAYITGGTNTVYADNVLFETTDAGANTVILMAGGSGTLRFGQVAQVRSGNTAGAAYRITGGTMTAQYRVLRADRSAAPTGATVGNVGEVIQLAVPTATVDGYVCTVADFVGPAYTWKTKALA